VKEDSGKVKEESSGETTKPEAIETDDKKSGKHCCAIVIIFKTKFDKNIKGFNLSIEIRYKK